MRRPTCRREALFLPLPQGKQKLQASSGVLFETNAAPSPLCFHARGVLRSAGSDQSINSLRVGSHVAETAGLRAYRVFDRGAYTRQKTWRRTPPGRLEPMKVHAVPWGGNFPKMNMSHQGKGLPREIRRCCCSSPFPSSEAHLFIVVMSPTASSSPEFR